LNAPQQSHGRRQLRRRVACQPLQHPVRRLRPLSQPPGGVLHRRGQQRPRRHRVRRRGQKGRREVQAAVGEQRQIHQVVRQPAAHACSLRVAAEVPHLPSFGRLHHGVRGGKGVRRGATQRERQCAQQRALRQHQIARAELLPRDSQRPLDVSQRTRAARAVFEQHLFCPHPFPLVHSHACLLSVSRTSTSVASAKNDAEGQSLAVSLSLAATYRAVAPSRCRRAGGVATNTAASVLGRRACAAAAAATTAASSPAKHTTPGAEEAAWGVLPRGTRCVRFGSRRPNERLCMTQGLK